MTAERPAVASATWAQVWVVKIWYPNEEPEVAAVFANRDEAMRCAAWWNWEEIRRYGRHSGVWAGVEETDFYPAGAWRPPVRSCVVR
jgi:hypothetical protein